MVLLVLSYANDPWMTQLGVFVLFGISTAHQIVTMKPGEHLIQFPLVNIQYN
jgi:hypothetical protein